MFKLIIVYPAQHRTGTIYITTDGTNTVINDTHVETNATADVTFPWM